MSDQQSNTLKPDLYISVLGAEGSGKTTYIAALLYSVMHADVAGGEHIRMQFLETVDDEKLRQSAHQVIPTILAQAEETSSEYIRRIWKAIYQERNMNYSGTVTGQDIFVKVRSDNLKLLNKDQIICVRDIPGGWVKDTSKWDDGSRQIREQLRASNALIIILDGPALLADGGYNIDQDRLLEVLIQALDTYAEEQKQLTHKSHLPVSVIFSKCDRIPEPDLKKLDDAIHALRKSLNLCFNQEMVAYFHGSAFGEDPTQIEENTPFPITKSNFFSQIFAGFYHLFDARRRTFKQRLRYGGIAIAATFVMLLLATTIYNNWQYQSQLDNLNAQFSPEQSLPEYIKHLTPLEDLLKQVKTCSTCFGKTNKTRVVLAQHVEIASQRLIKQFQQEQPEQATHAIDYYQQIAKQAKQLSLVQQRSHINEANQALEATMQQAHCKQQFQTIRQFEAQTPSAYENRLKQWKQYLATCPHSVNALAQQHQKNAYRSWRLSQGQRIINSIHNAKSLDKVWTDTDRFLQRLPNTAEDRPIAHQVLLTLGQHLLEYSKPQRTAQELQSISQLAQQWPLLTQRWELPPTLTGLSQSIADTGHQATSKQSNLTFNAALDNIRQIKGDCDRRVQSLWDLAGRYNRAPYKSRLATLIREERSQCERSACQQIRKQAPYLDSSNLEQQITQLFARYPKLQCGNELKTLLAARRNDSLWENLRTIQAKQVNANSEKAFDHAKTAYQNFIIRYQGKTHAEQQVNKAKQLLSQVSQQRQTFLLKQISQCWKNFATTGNNGQRCDTYGKAYLTRYPTPHGATIEIEKMLTFMSSIKQRNSYPIRIVAGSFPRRVSNDDIYITIDINGSRLSPCTTPDVSSETPTWNHQCTIRWKSQDNITVSAWAKASWGSDDLLFQRVLKGHLAITQLCGWTQAGQDEPRIWNDSASEWIKVRPAQNEHCNTLLPQTPQFNIK